MSGFLAEACDAARRRVVDARARTPGSVVEAQAMRRPRPAFAAQLSRSGVSVIAEIKRASPSRGPIAPIPDAVALGRAYVAGGAAAISVLTEPQWFAGSLVDLEQVAAHVEVPVLRKDFVVDAYQVWEAAAHGAAAVLLIVAALDDALLRELLQVCRAAGVEALVEVHDASEGRRAAAAWADAGATTQLVVGVNARDLGTLEVDPDRFAAVRHTLPADALTVAESGVQGPADVTRLAALGADGVLVGEAVAKAADPQALVRELVTAGSGTREGTQP